MSAARDAARRFAADRAVVFGSGLGVVPSEAEVLARVRYEDLGWAAPSVAGHGGDLLLATLDEHRVLLACGRPHLYEGRSQAELQVAVRDMAAWGVRRLVLTNAAGGLASWANAGSAVVATRVVDLQQAPTMGPEELPATAEGRAPAVCSALAEHFPARPGRYIAVAGPQYETPAEASWLAGLADVVGMSTAPEVRAAAELGLDVVLIAFVVNRAAAVADHEAVLEASRSFTTGLGACLGSVLAAAWPAPSRGAVE